MADIQPDDGPDPDDDVIEGELLDDVDPTNTPVELSVETLVADLDNFRKQSQRRLEDEVVRSSGGLVERLLPVFDACDGALAHGATEVEPIASALLGALAKEGLVRIDPLGEPFDPAVADAVVHEPGGGGDHIVSEVMRAGYTWRGRVLRPAMVKVTD